MNDDQADVIRVGPFVLVGAFNEGCPDEPMMPNPECYGCGGGFHDPVVSLRLMNESMKRIATPTVIAESATLNAGQCQVP